MNTKINENIELELDAELKELDAEAEKYGKLLYTQEQVAKMLHVTTQTLAKWRWKKTGPRFLGGTGKRVLYPRSCIIEYIEKETVNFS